MAQWYFEVWNEPNLPAFFTGSQQDYFDLYDATAATVKRVNPAYRVGGPATAGLDEGAWISEMISHCALAGVPLDFISTHSYGVDGALDEFGRDSHRLKARKDAVVMDVHNVHALVQASAMSNLPVIFTEWSASYTPRDNFHACLCAQNETNHERAEGGNQICFGGGGKNANAGELRRVHIGPYGVNMAAGACFTQQEKEDGEHHNRNQESVENAKCFPVVEEALEAVARRGADPGADGVGVAVAVNHV